MIIENNTNCKMALERLGFQKKGKIIWRLAGQENSKIYEIDVILSDCVNPCSIWCSWRDGRNDEPLSNIETIQELVQFCQDNELLPSPLIHNK